VILSVVIPTYNRADTIGTTLKSLGADQGIGSADYEIVVVDNRSTDDTAAIVRHMQAESRVAIRYVYEERAGVHYARNHGALQARGNLLYVTDDDMIAAPGMLAELLRLFEMDPKIGTASGMVLPRWEIEPPQWVLDHCQNTLLSLQFRPEELIVADHDIGIYSCHQMIRKSALLESGGFNPENTGGIWVGDGETGLGIKLRQHGYRFAYTSRAVVQHIIPPGRMTQAYLHRRMANQGAADAYTWYRENKPTSGQLLRHQVRAIAAAGADALRAAKSYLAGRSEWRLQRARMSYHRAWFEFDRRIRNDRNLQDFVLRDDWIDQQAETPAIPTPS
jgi:glycosyltransferase involved in cell wall biosynthesis